MVEKLLSSGADKEVEVGWYRQTALSKAAQKGHLEVNRMTNDENVELHLEC